MENFIAVQKKILYYEYEVLESYKKQTLLTLHEQTGFVPSCMSNTTEVL
jgi:hypothetical protein